MKNAALLVLIFGMLNTYACAPASSGQQASQSLSFTDILKHQKEMVICHLRGAHLYHSKFVKPHPESQHSFVPCFDSNNKKRTKNSKYSLIVALRYTDEALDECKKYDEARTALANHLEAQLQKKHDLETQCALTELEAGKFLKGQLLTFKQSLEEEIEDNQKKQHGQK